MRMRLIASAIAIIIASSAHPVVAQQMPVQVIQVPPLPSTPPTPPLPDEREKECIAKGHHWVVGHGAFPCMSDTEIAKEKEAKAACAASSGKWGPRGKAAIPGCVHYFADKGRSCQRNEDCQAKRCLADPSSTEHGMCAESDSPFGCFTQFVPKDAQATSSPHAFTRLCAD